MNRKIIYNFHVYSSGERRVIATADAFSKSFLQWLKFRPIAFRLKRELLDDTFDGKDQIDECKDVLKKNDFPRTHWMMALDTSLI